MKVAQRRWWWRSGLFLVVLGGCDVNIFSESERLGFSDDELHSIFPFESGAAIASGSEVCPRFHGYYDRALGTYHEDYTVRSCYDMSVEGPGLLDVEYECVQIESPGEVTWSLDRTASECTPDATLTSDRVVFRSVSLNDVRTVEAHLFELLATKLGRLAGVNPPDDWIKDEEPFLVAADVTVDLWPMLRERTTGEEVAWARGQLVVPKGLTSADQSNTLLTLGEGEETDAWISVRDATSPPMTVKAVATDSLSDLEIVPVCMVGTGLGDWWLRAIARDPSGHPVRGVPVTWSLEGDGSFELLYAEDVSPDYIAIEGPIDDSGELRSIVEARLGEHVAKVDLSWLTSLPSSCEAEVVTEDELRPRGCGCTTDERNSGLGWLPLGLFVVLALRRSRSVTRA